jgi:hypothetical protein
MAGAGRSFTDPSPASSTAFHNSERRSAPLATKALVSDHGRASPATSSYRGDMPGRSSMRRSTSSFVQRRGRRIGMDTVCSAAKANGNSAPSKYERTLPVARHRTITGRVEFFHRRHHPDRTAPTSERRGLPKSADFRRARTSKGRGLPKSAKVARAASNGESAGRGESQSKGFIGDRVVSAEARQKTKLEHDLPQPPRARRGRGDGRRRRRSVRRTSALPSAPAVQGPNARVCRGCHGEHRRGLRPADLLPIAIAHSLSPAAKTRRRFATSRQTSPPICSTSDLTGYYTIDWSRL